MDKTRDLNYIQSLYPDNMKKIQRYVSDACDKMEYKHSPMYDDYPDRVALNEICGSICSKIVSDAALEADAAEVKENSDEEVETYETRIQQLPPWGPPPGGPGPVRPPGGPPPWGPPPGGPGPVRPPGGPPPWGPPPGGPGPVRPPRPPMPPRPIPGGNWLNDIVKMLLLNEMYNRRCRGRFC